MGHPSGAKLRALPPLPIADLVPMLELGMAEPIQLHAVERSLHPVACRFAEQVHRVELPSTGPILLPWVLGGSKASCGSVARVRTLTSIPWP